MKRILGIDYGDVRVGLAVSDTLRITAQGLDNLVINRSDNKFIKEYDVETIVIGYTKDMDGTISEKAKKIYTLIPLI